MTKYLISIIFAVLVSISVASSEQTKTVFNPFTGKLDYITAISASYPGFVLRDSNNVLWSIAVNTSGALVSTVVTSVPAGYIRLNSFVLKDPSNAYWTVTINTSGALITTAGGSYASAINTLVLSDSNSIGWILSANTSGNLVTS